MDSKRHDSDDNSNMSDNIDDTGLISKESIIWFKEKLARKEDISMPEYCKEFEFTNEEDAHVAFLSLLSMTILPKATRIILTEKYEKWRRNEGEAFWSSREADYIIDVSTNETIGDLVKRGRFFTKRRLGSFPQDEPKEAMLPGGKHPRSDEDLPRQSSQSISNQSRRVDSRVDNLWVIDGEEIGRDLMEFRDRVVSENGGLTDPHEKLAVNFIFLIESIHQKMGLNSEVENRSWTVLCEATKSPLCPLESGVLLEANRWVDILEQESQEAIWELLKTSPPTDPNLKSILDSMKNSGQLWNGQSSNEDTYLKSLLGPFLATYLSELAYVSYNWTQTQNETRNEDSSLLIPDFSATTSAQKRELSLLLLEGKIASNKTFQIWDDRTKLGQEMKLALDSILKLLPKDDVCVIGILVKEPLVEFFSMAVLSEGVYIMRRFAVCHISSDIMNMTSIIPMMKAFQYVQEKVKKTVEAIQSVKVRPSESPSVPLSWLQPSFRKPKMKLVLDNE
ncbi:hypothetical protein BGZ49_001177 [Haplosporangium sp. Z 27]|nr:hypothetical protein BGZ49_001177 [Haplosporangium sp. Z 27]